MMLVMGRGGVRRSNGERFWDGDGRNNMALWGKYFLALVVLVCSLSRSLFWAVGGGSERLVELSSRDVWMFVGVTRYVNPHFP